MPRVGKVHYPYTPAGEKAAKKESARTGVKVERKPPATGKKK